MARLLVTHGPHFGATFELADRTTLGRSSGCTIQLLDEKASRLHSSIERVRDRWLVKDEGSSNGTGLNGRLLLEPAELTPGDEVAVGSNLMIYEPELEILRDLEGAGAVVLAWGTDHSVPASLDSKGRPSPAPFRLDSLLSTLAETVAGPRGVARPAAVVEAAVLGLGGRRGALLVAPMGGEPVKAVATHPHRARVTIARKLYDAVLDSQQPRRGEEGLIDLAVRGGRSMIVARPGAALAFPIRRGGRVRGIFYVESDDRGAFLDVPLAEALGALVVALAPLFGGPPRALRPAQPPADVRPPVAESSAMQAVVHQMKAQAETLTPLLLQGEVGTGKEYLTRYMHAIGPRAGGPCVASGCGGLPSSTLEIAFFGHEPGAVQGSDYLHRGLVEQADGGTLLVDDAEDLPPPLQARLLRVLQEGRFYRLGGTQPVRVDLRLVLGTSADLDDQVDQGAFRPDLLQLVSHQRITIPPLRTRLVDIEPLVRRFVKSFNVRTGTRLRGLTPDALALLETHPWPGNVDELRDVIELLLATASDDLVQGTDVEAELALLTDADGGEATNSQQRRRLTAVLRRTAGRVELAARLLNLPPHHLRELMRIHGLDELGT